MPKIKPTGGGNLRLPAYSTPENQWLLMQNFDMTHQEIFEPIKGSVKYHGASIGTNAPTAIMVNYNEGQDKQDVLTCVDDKILKKNLGANEYETLKSGLTQNKIKQSINLSDKTYFAHPKDGLFEYDGVSVIAKVSEILLRDIIVAKETNRCFGITDNNEIVWTDDLADMGGVPLTWNALNVDKLPPSQGDVPEKLMMKDGRLVILKTNSIWVYYILGAPENWKPEQISFSGGCIAPQTVKKVGNELWFLGFSPENGRGVYSFDGVNVKLLSYDYEPFLERINYFKIQDACAEHVNNLYKLSVAIDSSAENNYTLHFDTININKETGVPNIYGPHTYGFSASCVLNTRQFKGEHLFSRKHTDGARVFKVANYLTQYSDELVDNGQYIEPILLSGARADEGNGLDETWFKRYENLYVENPPVGTWFGIVEVLKGHESEVFESYDHFMAGNNASVEDLKLDTDPADFESLSYKNYLMDFVSDAIQLKVSMPVSKVKGAFKSLNYDVKPDRRKRNVSLVTI